MSKEQIINTLINLGLGKKEVEVYLFLAIQGPNSLEKITASLKQSVDSTIISLNELQSLSIVKISVENPEEYAAVPFEDVIDLFIEVKKEQVMSMKTQKEELISNWKTILKKNSAK